MHRVRVDLFLASWLSIRRLGMVPLLKYVVQGLLDLGAYRTFTNPTPSSHQPPTLSALHTRDVAVWQQENNHKTLREMQTLEKCRHSVTSETTTLETFRHDLQNSS